MEFSQKVHLTKSILPKSFPHEVEVIPTNPNHTSNYRNKTVQDILQPISPESQKVLSLKHMEIINYLKSLTPQTPIISITIKNNYRNEYQLKFTIPYQMVENLSYLIGIINLLEKDVKLNIVSGYYQIKPNGGHKPTKFDKYYHFFGVEKLLEEMDGNVIELSPNSFCRVNYHISKFLYHRVFLMIKQITNNFDRKKNLICFGRDINFPIEYYNSYFNELFGITHCPLVYGDCKSKSNLILTLAAKNEYPKRFNEYFRSNPKQNYIILVTAGRNGLGTELWKFITSHPQVQDIVYIACGRKSLGRNMEENTDMNVKHVIVMDEFPNTQSSNSIVHFSKV
tara:strand:+ start:79 stop:1095 length:1017 start_codon:yes stop_codon:yes gene_type:complete